MQPIVHGLEQQYRDRITFLYLDIRDPRNREGKARLGYEATPHFYLLTSDGRVLRGHSGLLRQQELEGWLRSVEGS